MRTGLAPAVGLAVLVGALAGCGPDRAAAPAAAAAEVAVPAYAAPPGAPPFCVRLSRTTALPEVPPALGVLVADPGNEPALHRLGEAVTELEGVLADVVDVGGHAHLTAGIESLLAFLHSATVNPVDDGLRERISTWLDVVGHEVQPVCEFPA